MARRSASSVVAMVVVLFAAVPVLVSCSAKKPAPPPTPKVTALTTAAYQQVLSGIDMKLATDTQGLSSARTPPAVGIAVGLTEADVSAAVRQLQGIHPPVPVKAAHAALISALRDFYADLGSAASASGAEQVCAGSSAMAMISRSSGATQLRSADARLATADIQMGSFLPQVMADTDRRLANGALVKRAKRGGLGLLTITNAGNTDAVLSLVVGSSDTAVMAIYVRADSSYKTKNIADGSYLFYMTSGTDWDAADHLFTRNCDFEKFSGTSDFTTTRKGDRIEYTVETIGLTPEVGGDVTETKVAPSQFPAP